MASISKPTFGGIEIPFPDDSTIEPFWISAENTTLGGKTRRDVMARKYRYELKWTYLSVDYYDALESIINDLDPATFTYGKWPQSASGVSCLGELSKRRLELGEGDSAFRSSVILTLTEVNSRI